jgi:eukaryotic-like serine/threonine-protein kinase
MDRLQASAVTTARRAVAEGPILGRYSLVRRLGSGGFGTVWLGRDERLQRDVAIKVVPRARVARGRGWREALAAARLAHPAVVALYEAGVDEDSAYLVSELVRGETLDALIDEGALSDREVARIGVALAEGLAHAHAQGVIHRDVKPANVIVPFDHGAGDAPAKLTDFGVAHVAGGDPLTRTGDVVGTLAYMAPEQAEGHRVTPAADLWALALVMHEALAGTNPVRAASPAATARRLAEPVPALGRRRRDLPPALCAALDRALDPDPARRGTLGELRRALAAAGSALSDDAGIVAPGRLERLTRERRRRPLAPPARVGAAVATAALVAVAVGAARGAAGLDGPVPVTAPLAAAAAGAAVLLLPRLAWLTAAVAAAGWLATVGGWPGTALIALLALAPVPLLLPRAGAWWSAPGAAPALGLLGLAGAFPALAGQARTLPRRATLGALGAWWLLLVEPVLGRRLLAGPAAGTPAPAGWREDLTGVGAAVLHPLLASPLPLLCGLWAVAAAVLPLVVRGRSVGSDLPAAALWAGLLAAATVALMPRIDAAEAVLGALAATVAATALGGLRPRADGESPTAGGPLPTPESL